MHDIILLGLFIGYLVFDRIMRSRELRMYIAGTKARDAADFTRGLAGRRPTDEKKPVEHELAKDLG